VIPENVAEDAGGSDHNKGHPGRSVFGYNSEDLCTKSEVTFCANVADFQ
jgi:hypothetical protein